MADKPNVPDRVAFNMEPALVREVERILGVTDLGKAPEVFRRAFTLLRIHVDAALDGKTIYMEPTKTTRKAGEKHIIVLPFTVSA